MAEDVIYPDWRELVRYAAPGPEPALLRDQPELCVLIAGLEPGGRILPHPGPLGVTATTRLAVLVVRVAAEDHG